MRAGPHGGKKVVIHMINPEPAADDWHEEGIILNLNARLRANGMPVAENQPTAWAHTRDALEEKLTAIAGLAQ